MLPCVGNIHSIYTVYFSFHLSVKAVWKQEVCFIRAAEYLLPLFGSFKYLGPIEALQGSLERSLPLSNILYWPLCSHTTRQRMKPRGFTERPRSGMKKGFVAMTEIGFIDVTHDVSHLLSPPTAQQEKLQVRPPDVDPSRPTNKSVFSLTLALREKRNGYSGVSGKTPQ